ncbi:MAG: DUF4150 domain-containing protein [Isosphaeraceae bacterium]
MGTVFANKRQIIFKGSGLTQTCPVPDVCKTPSPGGPVPIPYVNIAMDSDLADHTKNIKIEGKPVAIKSSNLKTSTGDEGGTAGGGIASSKIKGKLTWAVVSTDVKFEGEGVARFMDTCLHNGNGPNTGSQPHLGGFAGSYPNVDENQDCPRCGQKISTHKVKEVPQTKRSQKQTKKLFKKLRKQAKKAGRGRMVGVLVARCPGGKVTVFGAVSGGGIPGQAAAMAALGITAAPPVSPANLVGHQRMPGSNPPGQCAAPKLIQAAKDGGCTPLALSEAWCGPSNRFTSGHSVESCASCKYNLPQMLCSNDPKPPPPPSSPPAP